MTQQYEQQVSAIRKTYRREYNSLINQMLNETRAEDDNSLKSILLEGLSSIADTVNTLIPTNIFNPTYEPESQNNQELLLKKSSLTDYSKTQKQYLKEGLSAKKEIIRLKTLNNPSENKIDIVYQTTIYIHAMNSFAKELADQYINKKE